MKTILYMKSQNLFLHNIDSEFNYRMKTFFFELWGKKQSVLGVDKRQDLKKIWTQSSTLFHTLASCVQGPDVRDNVAVKLRTKMLTGGKNSQLMFCKAFKLQRSKVASYEVTLFKVSGAHRWIMWVILLWGVGGGKINFNVILSCLSGEAE